MNFDKLKRHDPAEWRAAHKLLFGVAMGVARHWKTTLLGHEIEDVVEDAIAVAMDEIASIPSEMKLKAFVASTVANMLMARVKSKAGPQSIDGKSDSLEQKLEAGDNHAEFGAVITPEDQIKRLETIVLAYEIFRSLPPRDFEFLWDRAVEGMTQQEIAIKHGWNVKAMTVLYRQTTERCRKKILSHPKGPLLLKELNWEHHLDE